MSQNNANAYLTTKVMSASPEELRLMLLDGAIKFARQGLAGLENKDFEASFTGISQCRNIVLELLNSIRDGDNRELAEKIKGVYTFLYSELVDVGVDRDTVRLGKVINLLEYERETWVLLMEKLLKERGQAPASGGTSLSLQA